MLLIIIGTLSAGVVGLFILLYSYKKGYFEDLEEIKYQMLREDDKE